MKVIQSISEVIRETLRQPSGRSGELYVWNLRHIHTQTDYLFYYLFLIQYPAAITVAILWSPLAWAGSTASIHFHVWVAVLFGGLLTAFPVYLIRTAPAAFLTRQVTAAAQMLMAALLIHLTGGRIETHFHIFGSLAFLSFYRDLRVLLTATLVIAADHLMRGLLIPQSVYGVITAYQWRFVEHVFWVLFEDVFLVIACVQSRTQLAKMATQQGRLERMNEEIEEAVRTRTAELSTRTRELAAARDAAMESTRLKSQFLANVSHEIRTPMNGVLGMTSLLLGTELTEDQRDQASTIRRSAEGLLTIINDILDLSKIEAGKLELTESDFDPCAEVEDVAQLLTESAERKHLTLVCDVDPDVPALVRGDSGRMRQVLMNLVGNAVKFTEQGEVVVRVRSLPSATGVCRLRFEITDTGIGIAESARKHLFQNFVQVDGGSNRRHEGTGLGLAISRQLVLLMGGEIGVESSPGTGSRFWFELTFSEAADQSRTQAVSMEGREVLLLDPNASSRTAIGRMLAAWGVQVHATATLNEALQTLDSCAGRSSMPAMILDVSLPVDDQTRLRSEVSRRRLRSKLRAILLTPLHEQGCWKPLQQQHGAICLAKPARSRDLRSALLQVFDLRVTAAETRSSVCVEENGQVGGQPLSILVAEDNPVNRKVAQRMLERLGHRCEIVEDGEQAVQAVQQSHYDLILMDCHMPVVDGFEATVRIRGLAGERSHIPIVAVTANAMSGEKERCIGIGMNGYLTKPISLAGLQEAITAATVQVRQSG